MKVMNFENAVILDAYFTHNYGVIYKGKEMPIHEDEEGVAYVEIPIPGKKGWPTLGALISHTFNGSPSDRLCWYFVNNDTEIPFEERYHPDNIRWYCVRDITKYDIRELAFSSDPDKIHPECVRVRREVVPLLHRPDLSVSVDAFGGVCFEVRTTGALQWVEHMENLERFVSYHTKDYYDLEKAGKTKGMTMAEKKKAGYHFHREKVADLIARAFVPNPFGLTKVIHFDGEVHNCCADNLAWVPANNEEFVREAKSVNWTKITDEMKIMIADLCALHCPKNREIQAWLLHKYGWNIRDRDISDIRQQRENRNKHLLGGYAKFCVGSEVPWIESSRIICGIIADLDANIEYAMGSNRVGRPEKLIPMGEMIKNAGLLYNPSSVQVINTFEKLHKAGELIPMLVHLGKIKDPNKGES